MKNSNKRTRIIVFALAILVVLVIVVGFISVKVITANDIPSSVTKEEAIKMFTAERERFEGVVSYILQKQEDVYWRVKGNRIITSYDYSLEIDDDKIKEDILHLNHKYKIWYISSSGYGGRHVVFDYSLTSGLLYSEEIAEEYDDQFITKLDDHWYLRSHPGT
jgi:hypothetical protein